jgi:hypothetical protein
MWILRVALRAALGAAATPAVAYTEDTSKLVLACTFEGGRAKFVAMIDRPKGEAKVSSISGEMRDGYATPYGPLIFFVTGKGRSVWRDTYFISDTDDTFVHLNEVYADGLDKQPFVVGQSGRCVRQERRPTQGNR